MVGKGSAVMRVLSRSAVVKRAEPKRKALDLPADLNSYPHPWSQTLDTDQKNQIIVTND